ncbi:hypothetical protein [Burkholderia ubonensis]|uniref:hypothetical protein n=1 Tax=Burkholderia ubonensis TaxID=101571 RepID=UPI0012FA23E8|nr:hypothetical protein [Burkholderia ubonensis]
MSGDISLAITQEQISALAEQIKKRVTSVNPGEPTATSEFCTAAGNIDSGAVCPKTLTRRSRDDISRGG